MEPTPNKARRRPSMLTMIVMTIGIWASLASTTAQDSSIVSGSQILDADDPVLRLQWEVPSNDPSGPEVMLWWETKSEGQPEVSASVIGTAKVRTENSQSLITSGNSGEFELTVTNLADVGPTTINWSIEATQDKGSGNGSEFDLAVEEVVVATASPAIAVPVINESGAPPQIYTITAKVPEASDDSLVVELVKRSWAAGAWTIDDDQATKLEPGPDPKIWSIPWTDCATPCESKVELLLPNPKIADRMIRVNVGDPEGSATVTARPAVESKPVWVTLPTVKVGADSIHFVDLVVPDDMPVEGLVGIRSEILNPNRDLTLCTAININGPSDPYEVGFDDDGINHVQAKLKPGRQTLDLQISPEPWDDCNVNNEPVDIRIGFITYGRQSPVPQVELG